MFSNNAKELALTQLSGFIPPNLFRNLQYTIIANFSFLICAFLKGNKHSISLFEKADERFSDEDLT